MRLGVITQPGSAVHESRAQGREFPFRKRKIPPAKEKIPENSRSVKCLILHALTQ